MFMFPLSTFSRRIAEPTPFLRPFFFLIEISSFLGTLTAITPSRTQKILLTPVLKKYLIGSSPMTSFILMTPTCQLFSIAFLAVASFLTFL